ncbi:MAG TPA: MraY family glycosyltransferase [Segeticoccus sp.]|uniref:glycosyltransferase family 4 protein n=1 Tax=Segeticoccus sp. TaxID=2706531 RepID=UPI002D7FF827|nr:MraY family glycosyltransferase [Segeticoccus sp.]HET8601040.1 MraY family glycosyltransferase [Segeticoccus sp.]
MREYVLVFVVAAAMTYAATPLVRWLAVRTGAFTPVRERDVHAVPIPRMGGVAMLMGFAAAMLAATRLPYLSQLFQTDQLVAVLGGAAIICALGAIDDIHGLDWLTKLAGQMIAAGVMAFGGVQLLSLPIGGVTVLPTQVLVPLTVIIVVISTNAVNFVDGLDGLAAGIVGISALAFFAWSYLISRSYDPPNVFSSATFITAALVGVCVGFLPHNFHPARLFMGDAGALLLGLLLAAATISMTGSIDPSSNLSGTSLAAAYLLPIVLPLAILTVPLLDVLLAVTRRIRRGQAPWTPDAHHLHHRMLQLGHSHRRAVLLLYLWSAIIALGAVSFAFVEVWVAAGVILGAAVFAFLLTWGLPRWRPVSRL